MHFTEISNAAAMVEFTYPAGGFIPELSQGSHFFQDLVESGIFYAAIFDERPGVRFNPALVVDRPNDLLTLDPDADPRLADVVHDCRVPGLELYSDLATQRVVCGVNTALA